MEQQCTLLEEPTGGTPASGSDDESQPKHKMRAKRNIYRRQSMCYYLPRCLKRFGCSMRYQLLRCFKRFGYFMLCSFFILMLYTIVQYFCIDVQKRHGKCRVYHIKPFVDCGFSQCRYRIGRQTRRWTSRTTYRHSRRRH